MSVSTICPDCYETTDDGATEIILQLKQGADPQQVIEEIKTEFGVDLVISEPLAPRFGIYGFAQPRFATFHRFAKSPRFSKSHSDDEDLLNLGDLANREDVISAEWDAPR